MRAPDTTQPHAPRLNDRGSSAGFAGAGPVGEASEGAVEAPSEKITVCICTYRRPELLGPLLEALAAQETGGRFTYSVVVIDNDHGRSAEAVVRRVAASSALAVHYDVEPRQNIARARNRAVEHATGDFVAFIDDDECPPPGWLLTLFTARQRYGADGVLGPVRPRYAEPPPAWVVRGRFYERATYPTGFVIDWRKGRTGNVLLRRDVFPADAPPFRPEFLSGEDQDFFRRVIAQGRVFVWCDEAAVHEVVPPVRWRRTFMIKRALLRGAVSLLHPTFGVRDVARSVVAVAAYTVVLPAALLLGQAAFMTYLVKLCDHLGRLLALVGIRLIRRPYVTE